MKSRPSFLPGIDLADTPRSWEHVLDGFNKRPAKRAILLALRSIAGNARAIFATNQRILDRLVGLGFDMSERSLRAHLAELEQSERLIVRSASGRGHSRRRIDLVFFRPGGEGDLPPNRKAIFPPTGRRSSPQPEGDLPPSIPQVQATCEPTPEPVSPLSSELREEKETLTLLAPPQEEPATPKTIPPSNSRRGRPAPARPPLPSRDETQEADARVNSWLARKTEEARLAELAAPTPVPMATPRPTIAPSVAPAHVETVDLIRRLASPCGPEAIEAAAQQMAAMLDDRHSIDFHRKVCRRIQAGQVPVKTVISAFKRARGEGTFNRGGNFTAFLREHDPGLFAQKADPRGHSPKFPGGR